MAAATAELPDFHAADTGATELPDFRAEDEEGGFLSSLLRVAGAATLTPAPLALRGFVSGATSTQEELKAKLPEMAPAEVSGAAIGRITVGAPLEIARRAGEAGMGGPPLTPEEALTSALFGTHIRGRVPRAAERAPDFRAEEVAAAEKPAATEAAAEVPAPAREAAAEAPAVAVEAQGDVTVRFGAEVATTEPAAISLKDFATGNAKPGGPSSIDGLNPVFTKRIEDMIAAMPPEIRQKFEITSGFRSLERQVEVYQTQHPGQPIPLDTHHRYGIAADTTKDPEVIAWINRNGEQYGVGYPLKGKGEENHLEPLEAGERIPTRDVALWAASQDGQRSVATQAAAGAPARIVAPSPLEVTDAHLDIFKKLEGARSPTDVSPKGAVGFGQIMPETARTYGFDPKRLGEEGYNNDVMRAIVSDLSNRYNGRVDDMLVAYNAGPGRADKWIAGGRKIADLPQETQRYLAKADSLGFTSGRVAPEYSLAATAREEGLLKGKDAERAATEYGGDIPPEPPRRGGAEPPAGEPLPLFEQRISQPVIKDVTKAAADLLREGNVVRDVSRRISDQVIELLQTDRLTTPRMQATLARHNVTVQEFASILDIDVTRAAQDLAAWSKVAPVLRALEGRPGAEADLALMREGLGISRPKGFWRRLTNVMRAALVSQISTAMRNLTTQAPRAGLDVLQQGIDSGLRKLFAPPGGYPKEVAPPDAMGAAMRLLRPLKTKAATDAVLSRFPLHHDHLFTNYMADISRKGGPAEGVLGAAETAVHYANTFNRFQEYVFRRAAFAAMLDRQMAMRGTSGARSWRHPLRSGPLETLIRENRIGDIPKDALDAAVAHALELTFSKNFSRDAGGFEGFAGKFIDLMNVPALTPILAFPRFLMNAVEFFFQHSTFGILRLTSSATRAAIAKGDWSAVSRTALGAGMLGAAYLMRISPQAGERWYDWRLEDGRTINLLPYGPFVFNLFVAELARQAIHGTMNHVSTTDMIRGLLSVNVRAGAGLYAVDTIINGITGVGNAEKASRLLMDFSGHIAANFLVPFRQVVDVLAEFDESPYVRSAREGPYVGFGEAGTGGLPAVGINVGPLMQSLPLLERMLPVSQPPTQAGPLKREAPLLKAMTGVPLSQSRGVAAREADRFGLSRQQIMPSTGHPTADRYVATYMGRAVAGVLDPVLAAGSYQRAPDPVKKEILRQGFSAAHKEALRAAAAEHPALFTRLKLESLPEIERWLIEQKTGQKPGRLVPSETAR